MERVATDKKTGYYLAPSHVKTKITCSSPVALTLFVTSINEVIMVRFPCNEQEPEYFEGRQAAIVCHGVKIGSFGIVHPEVNATPGAVSFCRLTELEVGFSVPLTLASLSFCQQVLQRFAILDPCTAVELDIGQLLQSI